MDSKDEVPHQNRVTDKSVALSGEDSIEQLLKIEHMSAEERKEVVRRYTRLRRAPRRARVKSHGIHITLQMDLVGDAEILDKLTNLQDTFRISRSQAIRTLCAAGAACITDKFVMDYSKK